MPATDPTSDPNHDTGSDHGNAQRERDADRTTPGHTTTRELATLVDDSDDTTRYTICPARADATELLTTWLTVDEPLVCDLDDWR